MMASFTELDTITDYINDARVLLQDVIQPYRYDDPSLLSAFNVTMFEARRIRPDIFLFRHRHRGDPLVQTFQQNQGQPVFIEEQFRLGLLHGLVGFALERDQEDIQDVRAAIFLKTFNDIFTGSRPAIAQAAPQQ
jgi:hypothetical protein